MPVPPHIRIAQRGFTLLELLIITAVIGIVAGLGVVGVTGARESARLARLQNDVAVINNGIDAYLAAGGVIPAGAAAEQVLAKLKTVASAQGSTSFGPSGPFIDPRLQVVRQTGNEAATMDPRADYPNGRGYFFVRQGGAPGIREFARGAASSLTAETRQGPMSSYTSGGEFLTSYAETPAAAPTSAAAPAAAAGQDEAARQGVDLVKLPRPVIVARTAGSTGAFSTYGGESVPLLNYPMQVSVSSPGSLPGQLQVSFNGAPFVNVTDPHGIAEVDPGNTVMARLASGDPTRYVSSDAVNVVFRAQPVAVFPIFPASDEIPATMTYAQAGGEIQGQTPIERPPVVVRLENIDQVPSKYRTTAYLQATFTKTTTARYTGLTTTVTNTSFSSPTFAPVTNAIDVGGFGTDTRIALYASVQSFKPEFVVAAEPLDRATEIAPTPLTVDIFPLKPIGLPLSVTISHSGTVPVGMRKVYTWATGSSAAAPLNPITGGVPTAGSFSYSAPLPNTTFPVATYTVAAQATGPPGTEHWFTSSVVNRTYIAITQVPLDYIGLNMFRANINGYVKGSIYMQAGDFAVLNAGATIEGNVYLPGTPAVFLPASGALVVRQGQAYDQAKDALISTNRITGREYDTQGELADPQTDLRKIVDLYGSTTPRNYEFRGTETSRIDGKLYRRADPPPVSTEKPSLPSEIALSNTLVPVTGTTQLASGSYAVTMNSTNSVLRLGVPGTLTKYVFGAGSSWTAGRVEILGPVQVFFNSSVSMSGITFGGSNSIYQTGFVVMSNYSVSINSGASVYGQFEARDSVLSVGNNGSFYGSAFAYEVAVSGQGFVDVSGGSGTNSP